MRDDASIVPYKWFASFVAISKVSPRQDEGIPPYSTFIGRQHIIKCSVGNGQDRLLRMLYPVLQSITRILQFCRGAAAGLAGAVDDIFVAAQFGQAHWAAGMQLLGADAHFAP